MEHLLFAHTGRKVAFMTKGFGNVTVIKHLETKVNYV